MKILHIISQRPNSTGSGFTLQNIIAQAEKSGHVNALVAGISIDCQPNLDQVASNNRFLVRFPHPETDFNLPGMSDVMPYPSSRFSELVPDRVDAYQKRFLQSIRQAIDQFNPDLIHSHHLWLVSAAARKVSGSLPMVTSCHSTDLRQCVLCPHIGERIYHEIRKIDRILALSQQQTEAIRKTFNIPQERIDIVGGGFDERIFARQANKPSNKIEMLYAGKLSYAKGVDWLLRVFASLERKDIHLHLAGSGTGPEAEHCLALAAECGSRVTLHGRIDQQELARLMARCHIFILPSFYEGLPLVLLEALASGCRLLTTDLPGCRELLAGTSPELAWLIPLPEEREVDRPHQQHWPQLYSALREAILAMSGIAATSAPLSPAEIQQRTAPFTWSSVFNKIEQSYQKALQTRA